MQGMVQDIVPDDSYQFVQADIGIVSLDFNNINTNINVFVPNEQQMGF